MISAATGATALVMVTLVKDHGLQYLFAPTFLTGALQIIAGRPKLAVLMRFVSRSVITGFVNALASLRDGRCRARHHLSVSESRIYAPIGKCVFARADSALPPIARPRVIHKV